MTEDDNALGGFFYLATTNKRYVNGINLPEIENEILEDYSGNFVLIGSKMVGGIEQKTKIRFKNVDNFETCFNAMDTGGYDSEYVLLTV